MAIDKKKRQLIEVEGVPYVVATMVKDWNVKVSDIEIVTDIKRQFKGIDFIMNTGEAKIKIDSKYHKAVSKKQKLTDYGVDVISIEISKDNGKEGWGVSSYTETDYMIDVIKDVGYYVIDVKLLKEYMRDNYHNYPKMYKGVGNEDYRAVTVSDLMDRGIILYYKEFDNIVPLSLAFRYKINKSYNEYIYPYIKELMYS